MVTQPGVKRRGCPALALERDLAQSGQLGCDVAWKSLGTSGPRVFKLTRFVEGSQTALEVGVLDPIEGGGDALSRASSAWTVEVLTTTARTIAEDRSAPPLIILDYLQCMPARGEDKGVFRPTPPKGTFQPCSCETSSRR
jgi:hypothetical protein